MSKMSKFTYFLEIVWLTVGLFAIVAGTREFYLHGFEKCIPLYIISAIAFAVYFLRRYARKKTIK